MRNPSVDCQAPHPWDGLSLGMKERCDVDGDNSEYPRHGDLDRLSGRSDFTGNEEWPCKPEDRIDRSASAQGEEVCCVEAS